MTPSSVINSTETCATCGKAAGKSCTQCKQVSYCDVSCQKSDWIQHKKVCFREGSACTRCLETIDISNLGECVVPHPVHLLQDHGSSIGPDGQAASFVCEGCDQPFTRTSKKRMCANIHEAPITVGAKFCYRGRHTIKPINEGDERRVRDDLLVLTTGPDLQREIDNIPTTMPNVSILTIQSTGYFDDSRTPELEVAMPKLKTLKLIDIAFDKVKLNTKLTPKLEALFMQNIPDECDITVLLPELKDFTMHYYGPADNMSWMNKMLATAKKLRTFDSYKLRVGPDLLFASNDLESIRLHRAEFLESVSVYAPKLRELNLQACYGLDGELDILESHPNFTSPHPGERSARPFVVNTTNACISPSIANVLRSEPRAIWDEQEDGSAVGVNPMEAMFANMNRGVGF